MALQCVCVWCVLACVGVCVVRRVHGVCGCVFARREQMSSPHALSTPSTPRLYTFSTLFTHPCPASTLSTTLSLDPVTPCPQRKNHIFITSTSKCALSHDFHHCCHGLLVFQSFLSFTLLKRCLAPFQAIDFAPKQMRRRHIDVKGFAPRNRNTCMECMTSCDWKATAGDQVDRPRRT